MIVELSDVRKNYRDVAALDGADLVIHEGSITGLIGPNGAGKTTSMGVISTLVKRDSGAVSVATVGIR